MDRKWSPRNGRDGIFFVWFEFLKDSLATLGMSMSDAYEPPPTVPEGANEKLGTLCASNADQPQDENLMWDVLHPTLDLSGLHAGQDIRRLRKWKRGLNKDGRAVLRWALKLWIGRASRARARS